MIHSTLQSLENLGKQTQSITWNDGSRLLFLPYGGRLLGLFPDRSDTNFFWVNQKLNSESQISEVFQENSWHNTGGERTWIAPELDIFFPDYPRCQTHWEPPQLDAVDYCFEHEAQKASLSRRMEIFLAREKRAVEVFLQKEYSPALNPLRLDADFADRFSGVSYAGYTQKTLLRYEGNGTVPSLGIWNINQLPIGGTLCVPTWYAAPPLLLFGDVPEDHLVANRNNITFQMNLPGEHKIGIRAAASTGRMGYLYRQSEKMSLVVRNFFNNPSGDYVDVPKFSPNDLGYSIFAVNIHSDLGDFCEMEYHAPAIRAEQGESESVDVSQIWAFHGENQQVREIAGLLLGADIPLT